MILENTVEIAVAHWWVLLAVERAHEPNVERRGRSLGAGQSALCKLYDMASGSGGK